MFRKIYYVENKFRMNNLGIVPFILNLLAIYAGYQGNTELQSKLKEISRKVTPALTNYALIESIEEKFVRVEAVDACILETMTEIETYFQNHRNQ